MINSWHQSVLAFVSVDRGERGLSAKRFVPSEKEVNLFQIYNMDSGNEMELDSHVDPNDFSTGVNLCLLGKRIESYKFCFGRTCISISMKFKKEVVNG